MKYRVVTKFDTEDFFRVQVSPTTDLKYCQTFVKNYTSRRRGIIEIHYYDGHLDAWYVNNGGADSWYI